MTKPSSFHFKNVALKTQIIRQETYCSHSRFKPSKKSLSFHSFWEIEESLKLVNDLHGIQSNFWKSTLVLTIMFFDRWHKDCAAWIFCTERKGCTRDVNRENKTSPQKTFDQWTVLSSFGLHNFFVHLNRAGCLNGQVEFKVPTRLKWFCPFYCFERIKAPFVFLRSSIP